MVMARNKTGNGSVESTASSMKTRISLSLQVGHHFTIRISISLCHEFYILDCKTILIEIRAMLSIIKVINQVNLSLRTIISASPQARLYANSNQQLRPHKDMFSFRFNQIFNQQ